MEQALEPQVACRLGHSLHHLGTDMAQLDRSGEASPSRRDSILEGSCSHPRRPCG